MTRLPRRTDYDAELLKMQRRIRKLEKTVNTLVKKQKEVCQCRN